jgi:hypothetical protein
VHNVNIDRIRPIISPAVLSDELPASAAVWCLLSCQGRLTMIALSDLLFGGPVDASVAAGVRLECDYV